MLAILQAFAKRSRSFSGGWSVSDLGRVGIGVRELGGYIGLGYAGSDGVD